MKRVIFLLAGLVFFSWSLSEAQTQQLTLDEAIEIAIENNTSLRQARNNIERSEVQIRGDRADYLPSINLNTSGSQTAGQQFDQANIEFDNFVSTSASGSVNSSIDLFTGFSRINNLRSSRAGLESTQQQYERNKETLIFNTAQAYLEVLLEKELVEVTRENLETARQQLEQVEAQVEVGTRPSVDLYEQRSQVANIELDLVRQENSHEMAKTQFIGYLQVDPFTEYELVEPDVQEENLVPQEYDLRQLVEDAMSNRRDVMAAEREIEQANYDINAAQGSRYPTVSLDASLSTNFSSRQQQPVNPENPEAGLETIPFSDQFFDQNIQRQAGLSVSIPIFNRFQTTNQIQQARIDQRQAQLELEDLQYEVIQEVRQAYNDYQGYSKELEASQAALEAAELAFETQQERYNVGSATLIELTEAQSSYIEALSSHVTAQYQFIFQERVLDYFLGRISEEPEVPGM